MKNPFVWQGVIYVLMMGVVVPPLVGVNLPLLWSPGTHKTLHILGVVLFLGHNITSLVWSWALERSGQPQLIRTSAVLFAWLDVFFTAGGMFLIFANGFILSTPYGGPFAYSWMTASLILVGVSAIPLIPILPRQIRIWRACQQDGEEADALILALTQSSNSWLMGGAVALFLAPYITIIWLMTSKPTLW